MFRSRFLAFLFSFMLLRAVADEGAGTSQADEGAGTPPADEGAGTSQADEGAGTSQADEGASTPPADEGGDEETEIQRLTRIVNENERLKAIDGFVSDIKTRHSDFDKDKVRGYLEELNKSDPQKAQELNNPLGWELLHIREFATKDVDNDYVGFGREGEGVDRSAEILEQVQKGGVSIADEARVLAKLL